MVLFKLMFLLLIFIAQGVWCQLRIFVQQSLYFLLQEQESLVSIFFSQDRNVGCIVVLNMGLLFSLFLSCSSHCSQRQKLSQRIRSVLDKSVLLLDLVTKQTVDLQKIVVVTENVNIIFLKVCCDYNRFDVIYRRSSILLVEVEVL